MDSTNSVITPNFSKTTADDLLDIYEQEPADANAEIATEAEKQAKIEIETPKQVAAEKIVKKLEEKETATKPVEAPPEEPKKAIEQEPKVKGKTATGEDFEVPLKLELEHAYQNGKIAKFTVDEAIKAYVDKDSFNREADRRVGQISKKEKALHSQVEEIKNNAAIVTDHFLGGNVIEAVAALSRMAGKNAGKDPVELQVNALNAMSKVAETWLKLTPEQKELFIEKQKAAEYKRAFERNQQSQSIEQQKAALQSKITNVCNSLGVSEEDFRQAYEDLTQLVGPEGKFKKVEDIQPEHVGHYLGYQVQRTRIAKIAEEVAAGLGQDDALIDEAALLLANEPNLSDNDIKDILGYVRTKPSPAVENLNRKVQTAQAAGLRTQLNEVLSPKKQEEEVDDDLYNDWFKNRPVVKR